MKSMTFKNIHRLSRILTVLLLGLFGAFLTYMYLSFSPLLIGSVQPLTDSSLLINFSQAGYQQAVDQLTQRRSIPDHDPNIRNPFSIDASVGIKLAP